MTLIGARRLKKFAKVLACAGVLLFLKGVSEKIHFYNVHSAGVDHAARGVVRDAPLSLIDARAAAPKVLDIIYKSLNEGDPSRAAQYLSPNILKSTTALDFICRPFTFRAYYIEAVTDRINGRFQVRVRGLFKPLDERAHTMIFYITPRQTVLESVEDTKDDWFGPQKAEAADVVRRFLYAAKAGETEIARTRVSEHFPFSECMENAEIQKHIAWLQEVQIAHTGIDQVGGLKITVTITFPECLGATANKVFYLDRIGSDLKIVRAFGNMHGWPDLCRWPPAYEDPDIEKYTLKRFGLASAPPAPPPSTDSSPPQETQESDSKTPPVFVHAEVMRKVEAQYTSEARQAKFAGVVKISLVVDEHGDPQDIKILNPPGLGLDETVLSAVRQWKFKPGQKNGVPVPSHATMEMIFRNN